MKTSLKNTFVLVCICAAVSVILAITNTFTAPIIEASEKAKANAALLEVMPDGKSFEAVDVGGMELPSVIREVYRAENGGYVFKMTTTGYSTGLVIMCGVRADGTVSGAVCLASTETLGYEKTFGSHFVGKDASSVDLVDTVSGATKTTGAYRSAIKAALNAAIVLGGGDVDFRTEEEILRDNLAAALPSANGEFEKYFITESIVGVDAVYKAANSTGFVCVIGEYFVALDPDAEVLTDVPEQIASAAQTALRLLLSSGASELKLSDFEGLPSQLISAKRTATGNYILEMKAAGYGINGDRHASGEYIVIRVSLSADGRILDCLTLSQAETEGIGSACADEAFYSQFVGKTEETYDAVDAIGSATLTTNGYKQAILRAFESVKIFEKGASK